MTPEQTLQTLSEAGVRLRVRSGRLELAGPTETRDWAQGLIREQFSALLCLLEKEERLWEAHLASLAAGRLTAPPVLPPRKG